MDLESELPGLVEIIVVDLDLIEDVRARKRCAQFRSERDRSGR